MISYTVIISLIYLLYIYLCIRMEVVCTWNLWLWGSICAPKQEEDQLLLQTEALSLHGKPSAYDFVNVCFKFNWLFLINSYIWKQLWRINETTFNLRVFNRQFVGLDSHGNGVDIVAIANAPSQIQTFHVDRNPNDLNRVRIRASNGFYLQVTIFQSHMFFSHVQSSKVMSIHPEIKWN